MSLILQPQVAFPIVRQIANHTDSTTYYVRAVVRNANGTTIDTVNLASQGGQRYQTSWQVPADPTGQGIYLSIVTSVYTDSGYTTKSENYGDEETTYLVFDRVLSSSRGGVGRGAGIDSGTVRRIIREELEKAKPEEVEEEEPEEPEDEVEEPKEPMRWDEILSGQQEIKKALADIPKQHVDITPILNDVKKVIQAVNDKEITPPTDITPILNKIDDVEEINSLSRQEAEKLLADLAQVITVQIPKKITEVLKSATFKLEPTTAKMDVEEKDEDANENKSKLFKFDINQLAQ